MSKQYIPAIGDIISIDFEPSAGIEITKRRPGLVVSEASLNASGYAFVIPITSTNREPALLYPEVKGANVTGYLYITQLRSLDFNVRQARFLEKIDPKTLAHVQAVLKHLMSIP